MNHILEATGFPEREARGLEGAETAVRAARHFPWERVIRCAMLCAIIGAVGCMAWRPAMLRLSHLVFLFSPSRGDSLAWRPETEDAPARLAARKQTPAPAEWRPETGAHGNWRIERPAANDLPSWRGTGILPIRWRRLSGNPWNWRDDSTMRLRRGEQPQPPQKPASAFRVKEEAEPKAELKQEYPQEQEKLPPLAIPSLAPLAEENSAPALSELPPLSLDEIAVPKSTPVPPPEPAGESESVDWKNREITAPIPGAYLTIYPRLKFVGLCVPGQGYIRKYNQVGVPRDPDGGKMSATDGRTPYGKYFIASRSGDEQGPRLELSWPSPEDAARIGLGMPERMAIEAAWRDQTLPPQDTTAGGGVTLTGLRGALESTDGGFSLETPQMEEIATALPDGAWVFIQE